MARSCVMPLDPESGVPERGVDPTKLCDPRRPLRICREIWMGHFERLYLTALLEQEGGNVRAAAQAADVDRTYLYRLLWKHKLR